MKSLHSNLKDFDKRASIESKKVKDISSAMEKIKKSLEAEKKTYITDLKKNLD
jgi:hypothetical protein